MAGLDFSVASDVTVHAAGTHLQTSLQDLQHLGVDHVVVDGTDKNLYLDLGTGTAVLSGSLPTFDANLNVTLDLHDTQLSQISNMAATLHTDGIDRVAVDMSASSIANAGANLGAGILDANLHSSGLQIEIDATTTTQGTTLAQILDAADGASHTLAQPASTLEADTASNSANVVSDQAALVAALQAAGVQDIHLGANANVTLTSTEVGALGHMLTADQSANLTMTSAGDMFVGVTLTDLINLGVDYVQDTHTADASVTVDVGNVSSAANLKQWVDNYWTHEQHDVFQHGNQAQVVDLNVGTNVNVSQIDANTLNELKLLGIDQVDGNGNTVHTH